MRYIFSYRGCVESSEEMADVVDENDVVVGVARRSEIRAGKLLHRGIEVIVRDSDGSFFVHRRALSKDIYPGRFAIAIGGMVGRGETYDEAARRELKEELAIEGAELISLFKRRDPDPENPHWRVAYEVTWDGPIDPDPSEIVDGRFVAAEDVPGLLGDPSLAYTRELFARVTGRE